MDANKSRFASLSFVGFDESASKTIYWQVTSSGDYSQDFRTGAEYARAAVALAIQLNAPHLMGHIMEAMPKPFTGIELGFIWTVFQMARASQVDRG